MAELPVPRVDEEVSGMSVRKGISVAAGAEVASAVESPRRVECDPRAGLIVDAVSEEPDSDEPVEPSDPWRSA